MKKTVSFSYLIIFYLIILPLVNTSKQNCFGGETITMISTRKENSIDGKFLKSVYTEAFKRAGKNLVYKYYPAKRGSRMTDIGRVDGELDRIYNYNEKHHNLVRVEEPLDSVRFSAFAIDPDIKLKGWESLRDTDYIVEYVLGTKVCSENLTRVVNKGKLFHVYHWSQGLKNLVNRRTDIYVEAERTILGALKTDEFKKSKIHLAGVMAEQTIHAFLVEEYKDLAPKLSTILKEMKKDGFIDKHIEISKTNTQ